MTVFHSTMLVQTSTMLNISASGAWELLKLRDTFLYVTSPAIRFDGAEDWPQTLMSTEVAFTTVAYPLRHLPGSAHTVRIVRVDEEAMEVDTEEFGGLIRTWNHSMKIEPISPSRCRYSDRVVLDAGLLTPFFWLFASLFYAYRQSRWRRLTSSLGVKGKEMIRCVV